jgi:hypothetical protein
VILWTLIWRRDWYPGMTMHGDALGPLPRLWSYGGMLRMHFSQSNFYVRAPHWWLALILLLLPLLWLRDRRQRVQRSTAGLCRRCGYDLRATPERCPECGTQTTNAAPL